jgi:hypothetical protein
VLLSTLLSPSRVCRLRGSIRSLRPRFYLRPLEGPFQRAGHACDSPHAVRAIRHTLDIVEGDNVQQVLDKQKRYRAG